MSPGPRGELIADACQTGCWVMVQRRVLEDAWHTFSDEHDPEEWSDIEVAAKRIRELEQAFDPMKKAVEEALLKDLSDGTDDNMLYQWAQAYDHMLQHSRRQQAHKSKYALHFRDVIVAGCISRAGTHRDLDKFRDVLERAFDRKMLEGAQQQKNGKPENSVWAQMCHSYHQLLPNNAPGKFQSGSKRTRGKREPRPARPRKHSPSRSSSAGSTGAQRPACAEHSPAQSYGALAGVVQIDLDCRVHSQRLVARSRQEQRGSDADRHCLPCELFLKRLEDLERREQEWQAERIHLLARVAQLEAYAKGPWTFQ